MATRAGDVAVTPTADVWAQFDVTKVNGKVQIGARKGDLTVDDGTETTTLAGVSRQLEIRSPRRITTTRRKKKGWRRDSRC